MPDRVVRLRPEDAQTVLWGGGGSLERLQHVNGGQVGRTVLRTLSHSSHARPAPKPRPTQAGQARRLNRRTEKTMPKETPRPERMSMEDRQRSHWADVSACRLGEGGEGGGRWV
jgi:hypothetical protein